MATAVLLTLLYDAWWLAVVLVGGVWLCRRLTGPFIDGAARNMRSAGVVRTAAVIGDIVIAPPALIRSGRRRGAARINPDSAARRRNTASEGW